MTVRDRYDVLILGSGFGGGLTAMILAQAGLSVAMIDSRRHPRFAIGESSTPAADLILHDLAEKYRLNEILPLSRFGTWRKSYPEILCGSKRGFTYLWHGDEERFQATADHRHELFVAASASREVADTQWYRPQVDQFFADAAQSRGAELWEEATIVHIAHPRPHDWQVTIHAAGDAEFKLNADFLIDATGPAGVLLRYLGITDLTSQLQTHSSAIYGHWEEMEPLENWLRERRAKTQDFPYPCDDSAIHHVFRDGWTWQLRFENGLTSLGSVFVPGREIDSIKEAEVLLMQDRPVLTKLLATARPAECPGRVFWTGRMQRLWAKAAGEDWAALPHTAGFIDALHSTGIAHTLSGIERLCGILLETPETHRPQELKNYSRRVIEELELIDRLVSGCYWGLRDFRLFSTWCHVYFAAATTYEKNRFAHSPSEAGFLCADDPEFVQRISDLHQRLQRLTQTSQKPSDAEVGDFRELVKLQIEPYNHVGLFDPPIPNMYWHTAAEKPGG